MPKKPKDSEISVEPPDRSETPLVDEQSRQLVANIARALQAHGVWCTVWPGEEPNQTVH